MQHFIVPVDGSDHSWRAVEVARWLAEQCDATVQVVEVGFAPRDRDLALRRLQEDVVARGLDDAELSIDVVITSATVAAALTELIDEHPEATIVMASHGRGRSAALLGSVADDILTSTFGPTIVVGPQVSPGRLRRATDRGSRIGPIIAPIDGSERSEKSLPLAAALAIELDTVPWLVNVGDDRKGLPEGAGETNYLRRHATDLSKLSGHRVEFDELHGRDPAEAILSYADRNDASLIVATSHGRTGWSLLALGSVCAQLVHRATCPVVIMRTPALVAS